MAKQEKPASNDAWKEGIEDGGRLDGSGARYPIVQAFVAKATGKPHLIRSDGTDEHENDNGSKLVGNIVPAPMVACIVGARRRWEIRDAADTILGYRSFDGPRGEKQDFERYKMRVHVLFYAMDGEGNAEFLCGTAGGTVANNLWSMLDGPRYAATEARKVTGKQGGSSPWMVKVSPCTVVVMTGAPGTKQKPKNVAAFADLIDVKAEPGARWHDAYSKPAQLAARSPEVVAWVDEWSYKTVTGAQQGD